MSRSPRGFGPRADCGLDEAIELGRQLADALDAAHEKRHPASRPEAGQHSGRASWIDRGSRAAAAPSVDDGSMRIKVIDFGLAKMLERPGAQGAMADLSASPTMTTPVATELGVISARRPT
jgi:hypothetical protein